MLISLVYFSVLLLLYFLLKGSTSPCPSEMFASNITATSALLRWSPRGNGTDTGKDPECEVCRARLSLVGHELSVYSCHQSYISWLLNSQDCFIQNTRHAYIPSCTSSYSRGGWQAACFIWRGEQATATFVPCYIIGLRIMCFMPVAKVTYMYWLGYT